MFLLKSGLLSLTPLETPSPMKLFQDFSPQQSNSFTFNNRDLIMIIRELICGQRYKYPICHFCLQILFLMQSKESKSPKLHDWEVVQNIAPYLNVNELLKTSTLSKEYNYALRKYIHKYLLNNKPLSGNQNQLNMVKKLYHRQVKVFNEGKQVSYTPNLILKSVQVGKTYVLIETLQGKRFLMKNQNLRSNHFELVELNKKYNSETVLLLGEFVYVVNHNELIKLRLEETVQGLIEEVDAIQFETEIIHIKESTSHIFVVTNSAFNENKVFSVSLNDFKAVQILYEDKTSETKHFNIANLSIGAGIAFYINNYKVYQLELENTKEPTLLSILKDKQIRSIINGSKHFFAVEKGNKLTEEWDTKDLVQWANNQGYEDYVKIFKSQKVTGKTLLTMDKRYMEDVLGILNVKIQQRLMVQLEENNHLKQETCNIFGWGRNDKGQLSLNPSNNVSNPYKLVLPEGFKFLKCSNNMTLIHNIKTGEILMNSVNDGKFGWKKIFQKAINIWSISIYKEEIVVICSVEKGHIAQNQSEVPVHHKKQKLRTAKNIIDKIQWDQNVDKKDFRVGYFDKFTGILQISFEQLLESADIKDYRIEYFKRSGEIVWSKKDRIDIL